MTEGSGGMLSDGMRSMLTMGEICLEDGMSDRRTGWAGKDSIG